ncbi:MAG: hypothetical protein U9N79_05580, partial [Actinomycetota bacterium]|nr:hypothetical protein [Actinomycetota bacterium]
MMRLTPPPSGSGGRVPGLTVPLRQPITRILHQSARGDVKDVQRSITSPILTRHTAVRGGHRLTFPHAARATISDMNPVL